MSGRPAAPVRVDGMIFSVSCWSSGWFEHAVFARALASELDAVGIVNDAIEDRTTPAGQPRRPLAEIGVHSGRGDRAVHLALLGDGAGIGVVARLLVDRRGFAGLGQSNNLGGLIFCRFELPFSEALR